MLANSIVKATKANMRTYVLLIIRFLSRIGVTIGRNELAFALSDCWENLKDFESEKVHVFIIEYNGLLVISCSVE